MALSHYPPSTPVNPTAERGTGGAAWGPLQTPGSEHFTPSWSLLGEVGRDRNMAPVGGLGDP